MNKEFIIFTLVSGSLIGGALALSQYNTNKDRELREKEIENQKLYFDKLSPEQVEQLEKDKLEVKKAQIELDRAVAEKNRSEAELKKTVTDFKDAITEQIRKEVKQNIEGDMRRTFDDWATKYEVKLDSKVDRVVSRIDTLSDKYGGVKMPTTATPSINVVNAPNTNN